MAREILTSSDSIWALSAEESANVLAESKSNAYSLTSQN